MAKPDLREMTDASLLDAFGTAMFVRMKNRDESGGGDLRAEILRRMAAGSSRATSEPACSYRDVVAGASCIRQDMPHEEHWLPVTTAKRVIDARPYADGVTDATAHLQAGLDDGQIARSHPPGCRCERCFHERVQG